MTQGQCVTVLLSKWLSECTSVGFLIRIGVGSKTSGLGSEGTTQAKGMTLG